MAARMGSIFYWLGVGLAVVCAVGAALILFGAFPHMGSPVGGIHSPVGYLTPQKTIVLEKSFLHPAKSWEPQNYNATIEYVVMVRVDGIGPSDFHKFESDLLEMTRIICVDTYGRTNACWGIENRNAWEELPLGKLPMDATSIAAAYGYKVTGTIEKRVWMNNYTYALLYVFVVLVFGLFWYGVGWAARYVLRGRIKRNAYYPPSAY